MPVAGDDEAVALMNDSRFGLTASVWTRDAEAAAAIGDRVETGTLLPEPMRLSRSGAGLGRDQEFGPRLRPIGRELYPPHPPEELPPAHWPIIRNRRFASTVWCTWPMVCQGDHSMRGILLWVIGIPIPVIILLYLFNVL